MPLRDTFNQVKHKLEDLNRQHNILPFGQQGGGQHQQHPPQQQQYPYQSQPQPQQQQTYYPPPQGQYPQHQQGYQQQQHHHQPYPGHDGGGPPPPPIPMHSRPGDSGGGPPGGPPPPPRPPPDSSRPPSHHPPDHPPPAYGAAPPGPPPGGGPAGHYWRATFHPSHPVSHDWDHKRGNGDNGWGNAELEHYTELPENSFHTPDGKLVIRAVSRPDHPDPAQRYTSARLVSRQTLGRHKGVLTTWLTLPCADGIWPAFWLLPREPFTWPYDGEVDIAETWNGDGENHSCLHWGFFTAEDHHKHRVRGTRPPDMSRGRPIRFDFAWDCSTTNGCAPGRFMWYIDGQPVMKNLMPEGARSIDDWCIIMNVAMGGNVCCGKTPAPGSYDMVVHEVRLCEEPEGGGWGKFETDWWHCPDGGMM